ncbi:ABC transporter ATP-binding protein [Aliidongia dinghuensis]|uniref:ABC transporter ATP-binding protein n=1 Tax=Aliidongia dinghuensis TaxID=1867774 RepID=A0A8J2YZZ0_9PROT|nr:ABC transporter ATP-binding protein [Aliidongia dinghuensis]GGF42480.1 ABC transporter ATP-binding protein [Aliidongia dinghuensis]
MIRLEHITKRFGPVAPPSVDDLCLDMPEGTTTALIGPSGCGKTTTMRMINRMIEPTSGRIVVAGEDVTRIDPVELRRRIGYVIQQIGLFPHMTIAANIATVPRLLGWAEARIADRADELLQLVGLEPAKFRARYPRELSGGQRQRVGVARALAADPPVMLMDEPFGAIDPIARGRLQDEFKEILKRVRKTVVIVTHDLDEAIKMGDFIALLRDGRLVQHDTPDAILARPANEFVEAFIGPDRALRRLGLLTLGDVMAPATAGEEGPRAPSTTSLRDALSLLLAEGTASLVVTSTEGRPVGRASRDDILNAHAGALDAVRRAGAEQTA